MRVVLVIAALEVRRRLRDRSLVIQGVVGPIALAGIIGLAFGGTGSGIGDMGLGLVDEDGSEVSTLALDGLRSAAVADDGPPVVVVDVASRPEAERRVDDGDLDAALLVPAGFGAAVTSGQPAELVVLASGTDRIDGDVAVAVAESVAARLDAERLTRAVAGVAGVEAPGSAPVSALRIEEQPVGGDFDAVAYFAPSMGILFLFFTVGAGARGLLREKADGTLARVRAAPIPGSALLTGKALAVFVAGVVSLTTIWAVTSVAFGADWGDPLGVGLVLVATVVAVAGISAVLTGLARSENQADALTSAVAFVLALVGGNFISPGALPPLVQRLSLLTPNGWALRALTELSAGEASVADVVPAVLVLLAMGVVTGLLGTRLLSRSLA